MAQTRFRVGFIGVGRPWKTEGATGFGMAHEHALGYKASGKCDMVACADLNAENASAFAQKHGFSATYQDYEKMLAEEKLDIVSICTWPHLHAPMTVAACEAGVKAVHCEKPMAPTWGEAKRMDSVANAHGVKLTFNHQRRFLKPFQKAKEAVAAGEIGKLLRMEASCGDMFDWGTHWLDMLFYYNGETPAEWVIGQIDSRSEHKTFGVRQEDQGVCHYQAANAVQGILTTGKGAQPGVAHRLIGDNGVVEVRWEAPHVRVLSGKGSGWRAIEQPDNLHGPNSNERAVADIVDALAAGRTSVLCSANALRTTEVIMATFYSSKIRGRVDLPLTYDGNAMHDMMDASEFGPGRAD